MKKYLFIIFLFAGVCFLVPSAHATDTWTGNGADTNWSNPANWSLGAVPGLNETALFTASSKNSSWDSNANTVICKPAINSLFVQVDASYTGVITVNCPTLFVVGGWTYSAAAASFVAQTSTLYIGYTSAFNFVPGSANYYNLSISTTTAGGFSTDLGGGTATVTNNLYFNAGGGGTFSNGTVKVAKDVIYSSGGAVSGNGIIYLNGAGAQSLTSVNPNVATYPNLTFGGAGTVTIGTAGDNCISVSGNWTYISGTLAFAANCSYGNYRIMFVGTSTTHVFTPGAQSYPDIEFKGTNSTLSISAGATVNMTQFTPCGSGMCNLYINADQNSQITGGSISPSGLVKMTSANFGTGASGPGNGTIVLHGLSAGISSNGGVFPNVFIATSTVLTLNGTIPVGGNWTVATTTGTSDGASVTANTSTLKFVGIGGTQNFSPGTSSAQNANQYYNIDIENKSTALTMPTGIGSTTYVTHTLTIGSDVNSSMMGGAIVARGDVNVSSTDFGTSGSPGTNIILLTGTSTQQNITSKGGELPNVTVNKTAGVAMVTTNAVIGNALIVAAGELRLSSTTATTTAFEVDGPVTVSAGGMLSNYAVVSSTIKLGSSTTNSGVILFDGGTGNCGTTGPNDVMLRSTATGTQRSWSGAGTFIMRSVDVKDQAGTAAISVANGLDSGNNGANWTFGTGPIPQFIQSVTANGGSGTTQVPLSFGFWPKSGDLIVVVTSARSQNISAPTDTAGNTYYLAASSTFSNYALSVYYAKNVTSTPSQTFTVTANGAGGGGAYLSASAFEYTGIAPSSTFDNAIVNTDTSGNVTALTSFSLTGQSQNEVYFGAMTLAASTTASSGGGWTARTGNTNNNSLQALYDEDTISVNTLTTAATWAAVASTSYSAILSIFKSPMMASYAPSGTLCSAPFDTKVASGVQLNSLLWQGTRPVNTTVEFQLAVSSSSGGPWNYVGSDGTGNTYFVTPNPGVPVGLSYAPFNGYRYFSYCVTLLSNAARTLGPSVDNVIVNWSP